MFFYTDKKKQKLRHYLVSVFKNYFKRLLSIFKLLTLTFKTIKNIFNISIVFLFLKLLLTTCLYYF